MRKQGDRQPKTKLSVFGYLIFFGSVAFNVMIGVMLYDLIAEKSGGNKVVIALSMLAIIAVLALISTLIDFFRRKQMVEKPTSRILDATEKIANGDFSVRLSVESSSEQYNAYDIIMENVNLMAEELSRQKELRSDFISSVSHEFKTPLTVINGYAKALKKEKLNDRCSEIADELIVATARLSKLVENLLKLNKLENATEIISEIKVPVVESVSVAVLAYESKLEEKGIDLSCSLPDEEIFVFAPEGYLDIVWNNLISNAVKFTKRNGKISVSVSSDDEFVKIAVSDSGNGIEPQKIQRIFDKFYQADASRASEGNGLGLALVKKVIEVMGGEITVNSKMGEGSTFIVRIKK